MNEISECKRAKGFHASCFHVVINYDLILAFFLAIKSECRHCLASLIVNLTNGLTSPFTVLRKAFESFDSNKSGSISTETVAEILRLMGQPFNKQILEEMIEEVDEDKSGRLEFEEFIILAAKFIVEEDEEARKIDFNPTCETIV